MPSKGSKERKIILSALFVVIFIDQILMKKSLTHTLNNKKNENFFKSQYTRAALVFINKLKYKLFISVYTKYNIFLKSQ